MTTPKHILLLDIDGLRPDVFQQALERNDAPHLARILGGRAGAHRLQIPIVSNAPSITFCCQASLFTGKHPKEHGVPGNQ
ncbi:MAG: alkaline phosphatase family protein, partial [Sphaerospermopsis sp. SIO1G2]|nr:alkaline phosphatase family protein [Sphaerospermopsis sp. SIO1G2]